MILIATMIDDENDRQYMQQIYEKNRRLMFSIALRYTSNEYDCEDIVHDTVEKLCKKVDKLKTLSGYTLQAYIAYAARNTAINFHKHQKVLQRHVTEVVEDNFEVADSPEIQIERIEELKSKSASLEKVWNQLPEQDRDILMMKYVFDDSNEEIANFLQCNRDCVRMRLFRARRRALRLMKEGIENDENDKTRATN